jgi:hypothetical protein
LVIEAAKKITSLELKNNLNWYIHEGGLDRAFATSGIFTITVFIPLPFPST